MNDTFNEDYAVGELGEKLVLAKLQETFPLALRINEEFKGFDIFVPELKICFEVKTDHKHKETGNLVVEFSFNDRPSGIITTTAEYWVFVMDTEWFYVKPDRIKNCIIETQPRYLKFIAEGDTKEKEVYLIPIEVMREYIFKEEKL